MYLQNYRERVHHYVTAMTMFRKFYEEGSLSAADYELVEAAIANKYRISRKSVIRMHFLLKRCGSGFEID